MGVGWPRTATLAKWLKLAHPRIYALPLVGLSCLPVLLSSRGQKNERRENAWAQGDRGGTSWSEGGREAPRFSTHQCLQRCCHGQPSCSESAGSAVARPRQRISSSTLSLSLSVAVREAPVHQSRDPGRERRACEEQTGAGANSERAHQRAEVQVSGSGGARLPEILLLPSDKRPPPAGTSLSRTSSHQRRRTRS